MLTQKRPFAGEDVAATLASVLRGEPNWSALPAETTHLTSVLQRCLEKDVKRRLRDVADVKLLLEAPPWSPVVTRGATSKRAAWMWATAVLSLIAGGTIAALLLSSRSGTIPPRVARLAPRRSVSTRSQRGCLDQIGWTRVDRMRETHMRAQRRRGRLGTSVVPLGALNVGKNTHA